VSDDVMTLADGVSRAKDPLKAGIQLARRRIEMANSIGWPALAASWQSTLDQLEGRPVTPEVPHDNTPPGMPSSFYPPRETVPLKASLTTRETEVLKALVGGGSRKSIGKDMGLSPSTIDQYVKSIHLKLNVTTSVQAAVLAVKAGLA
jgi:DNA-binding NarL/FixJ family response regulator